MIATTNCAAGSFAPWRALGCFAIGGGLLRIASSGLDWTTMSWQLEVFALVIDLSLLFGLTGFYFANASRLGALGFVGYTVAAAGFAFITGPDGVAYGIDIYQTGVAVIGVGILILAAALLLRRTAKAVAGAWLGSVTFTVAGSLVGRPGAGFTAGGVLFGAGFVLAGTSLMAAANRS